MTSRKRGQHSLPGGTPSGQVRAGGRAEPPAQSGPRLGPHVSVAPGVQAHVPIHMPAGPAAMAVTEEAQRQAQAGGPGRPSHPVLESPGGAQVGSDLPQRVHG